jgi:hypothetical protein
MDPVTIALLGSAVAVAGGRIQTYLKQRFLREEFGRGRAKETEDLVDLETQDLKQALESLESDIQVSHLPEVEEERVSEDVREMRRIVVERTNELKQQLLEQERRSNEHSAKQMRRSFWMDFVSNGIFFFAGLAVSAVTGLGGG